jgi:hypothetical protein
MGAWLFVRWWTAQIERPWRAPSGDVWEAAFTRPRHRIAWAAFAEYAGTNELYLETVWGGTWARGQRVVVRSGGVEVVSDLWMA